MGNQYAIKKIGFDNEYISYPSPTGILGLLSKGDALIQWACNLCVKENNPIAWKQMRDNTADIGSVLHHLIETFINMHIKETGKLIDYINYIKTLDSNIRQMFWQFYIWQHYNVKQYLASEQFVCDRELCYAGTLDFIYEGIDNKIYCVDLKTSNMIYPEHEIQTVAYKTARESMSGKYDKLSIVNNNSWNDIVEYNELKIDKCAILNISRDYFDLEYKIINDIEYKQKSFEALLSFYYISKKRRVNNLRAKERR
jgi:hypothetical protein